MESYNYYEKEKNRILKELRETLKKTGDNIQNLDIRYELEDENYMNREEGMGFCAWSDNYVYIRGVYDGYT